MDSYRGFNEGVFYSEDELNEVDKFIRKEYKKQGITFFKSALDKWQRFMKELEELGFKISKKDYSKKTNKELIKKYEILEKCEPAITLVGSAGHICMYLGKVDNNHFVIHQSGYSYKTEDGTQLHVRRVNVNDTELEGGSDINSWTEISVFKP